MKLKKFILRHFDAQTPVLNSKMETFKCKYCTKIYAKHTTRMSNHLYECKGSPVAVKQFVKDAKACKSKKSNNKKLKEKKRKHSSSSSNCLSGSDKTESINDDSIQQNSDAENVSCNIKKHGNSSKLKSFFDRMSKQEQNHCSILLAKAIYTSGTSFRFVENEFFLQFLSTLRPVFEPPNRDNISKTLLDKVYSEIQSQVEEKVINANSIALQCDSFSTIKNEGIINFIVNTPTPVFYLHIPTKSDSQTGEYLAEKISDVIIQIGPKKVLGVITDNAAYCRKAWRIIEEKYKSDQIFAYGCVAHVLNLLVSDICNQPTLKSIFKNATAIVKEIKQSHILQASFVEIQTSAVEERVLTSLKLPARTRWGSSLDCLKSIHENIYNLKQLSISKNSIKMDKLTREIILNDEFWVKIKKMIILLEPVIVWLKKAEGDESQISHIHHVFFELNKHFIQELKNSSLALLPLSEIENVMNFLNRRAEMVLTDLHFAANILDPKFRGKELEPYQVANGSEMITKLASKFNVSKDKVVIELIDYNNESGFWSSKFVRHSAGLVSALDWWRGSCGSTALSKIAIAVLGLPCTSAATERSFSTYGWIHCAKRNRFKIERASRVTYICHNIKLLNSCKKNEREDIDSASESEQLFEDESEEDNNLIDSNTEIHQFNYIPSSINFSHVD